ncbi:5-amino-6-(5-phosphoribosylamino)uracil reductase - like protein [Thioalkalivibrio nitratireducens DSM 14787]|uniref:5-amino-6-(5-phosphoribosylamino)uracil reductase-like protein n=1 Tax=Thioalkalivibrio nitratireducens (strain DSM 14787 / UNIQEM 213 / ALEN2) TaxID=1255043 RepID=L0DWU4_THIND|nr:dihydrofolate reductase family protein [Thioalkalivibrio nitratireducens]AGA32836.1 5-amino-6-(5-phosphoribosylamino)uracil reductase - like protein [Thioalkalivibrio nitratireducens DSM 14787]
MSERKVLRLFPAPQQEQDLEGLYLADAIGPIDASGRAFVYTNFISSLDGRIAVENPRKGRRTAPPAITNPRDWRLFQELAARADALIVSAAFLRQIPDRQLQDKLPVERDPRFQDLHDWRKARDLPPQPALVVLSRSLDPNLAERCSLLERPVYFALGRKADLGNREAVETTGVRILIAGDGEHVEGKPLIDALGREGFRRIYSMAGPRVLHALLKDRVLHRIYLTHFHRLLGGQSFDTLLEGLALDPPAAFIPHTLYYDTLGSDGVGQFFASYDIR